jgi:hypothetical protein
VKYPDTVARRLAYVDRAKNALVFADDALAVAYLLFGDDPAKAFYEGVLVHTDPGQERTATHNWYCAKRLGEPFIEKHGATLATLQWPLFGWDPAFSALNAKILAEASVPHGAGTTAPRCTVFRHLPSGGAYAIPVQTSAEGHAFVDLGVADDAVRDLRNDNKALRRQLDELRREVRKLDDRRTKPDGTRQDGRGGGSGARGGGRGGGRSGGAPRGGATDACTCCHVRISSRRRRHSETETGRW